MPPARSDSAQGDRIGADEAAAPLLGFIRAARGAGVRISPAETQDALRAAALLGYADRGQLAQALGVTLAKSPAEKALLAACFDRYFTAAAPPPAAPVRDIAAEETGLAALLLSGDGAALAAGLEAAGRGVGVAAISFFTQVNLFTRRMLEAMGLAALEARIAALRASAHPQDQARAEQLQAGLAGLRGAARALVTRNLELFAKPENARLRDAALAEARLAGLAQRDRARLRQMVRAMAKKLATRHARPRRQPRRGQLDARRTLRRNLPWGGVMFRTIWRQKRIERPRIVVLCDVSGSVAAVAEFLLAFLYALSGVLAGLRAFAFCSGLSEVSDILRRLPAEEAGAEILRTIGFGGSNYGVALEDFERGFMDTIDRRTSVIILGDARSNRADPRVDILARMAARAKRVVWLNPEFRTAWGTGDSEMPRYAPHCSVVRPCGSLKELETAVADLLRDARSA